MPTNHSLPSCLSHHSTFTFSLCAVSTYRLLHSPPRPAMVLVHANSPLLIIMSHSHFFPYHSPLCNLQVPTLTTLSQARYLSNWPIFVLFSGCHPLLPGHNTAPPRVSLFVKPSHSSKLIILPLRTIFLWHPLLPTPLLSHISISPQ